MKAFEKAKTIQTWLKHIKFKLLRRCREENICKKKEAKKDCITTRDLIKAIRNSWCRETCYPRMQDVWDPRRPFVGQCAVTAMVIQDYLGGDIRYCSHLHHYWNFLPEGVDMDMTKDQFPRDVKICFDAIVPRSKFTASGDADTLARYVLLKHMVEKNLGISKYLSHYSRTKDGGLIN